MTRKFDWCGYEWQCCAEGGRLIHPDEPNYWYSEESVSIDDCDVMKLDILERPNEIKHWDGKTYKPFYAVGLVKSVESFSYGTFECDCILPIGEQLCSAFWLSGKESWPPEIDICENMSNRCGSYWKSLFWWNDTTNLHYRMYPEAEKELVGDKKMPVFKFSNPAKNWHRYTCVWEPKMVRFYIDGILVRTIDDFEILKTFHGKTQNVIFSNWPWKANQYGMRIHTPIKQRFMVKNFSYTPFHETVFVIVPS